MIAQTPWTWGLETNDESVQIISTDGQHLATVAQYPIWENANLMIAAPLLLEALKAMMIFQDHEQYNDDPDDAENEALRLARFAIKAAGRECKGDR